jgi:hypothetical protein
VLPQPGTNLPALGPQINLKHQQLVCVWVGVTLDHGGDAEF